MKPQITSKVILLLAFCLMHSIHNAKAQSSEFFKSYEVYTQSDFDNASGMLLTYDSNYVVACSSYDSLEREYAIELIKFDATGHHLWRHSFPISSQDLYYTKVAQSPDSGFVISTTYQSPADTTEKVLLIKTDEKGNKQWVKLIGDRTVSQQNSDLKISGNYIFMLSCGGIKLPKNGQEPDYFIAKLDMGGNVIWYHKYNYTGYPYPKAFIVTPKNTIFVSTEIINNGYPQFALSKIDSTGSLVWSKIYSSQFDIQALDMMMNSKGDLMMTGHEWASNSKMWDIFLMDADTSGSIKWIHAYGGSNNDEGWHVFQLKSGYIICAEPESFGNVSRAALLKTDTNGKLQWMKLYGDTGSFPNGAVQLNNGFVIYGINGTYSSYAPIYLVRTDTNGITSCEWQSVTFPDSSFTFTATNTGTSGIVYGDSTFNLQENIDSLIEYYNCQSTAYVPTIQNKQNEVVVFPNPNRGTFTAQIKLSVTSTDNLSFEVYNVFGSQVFIQSLHETGGDNTIAIPQPPGIYFYRVLDINNSVIGEGKFVIQ